VQEHLKLTQVCCKKHAYETECLQVPCTYLLPWARAASDRCHLQAPCEAPELSSVVLSSAVLSGAVLFGAVLSSAVLSSAVLSSAVLSTAHDCGLHTHSANPQTVETGDFQILNLLLCGMQYADVYPAGASLQNTMYDSHSFDSHSDVEDIVWLDLTTRTFHGLLSFLFFVTFHVPCRA
jgi:Pentapeptide repeats (8 copies)